MFIIKSLLILKNLNQQIKLIKKKEDNILLFNCKTKLLNFIYKQYGKF